MRMGGGTPVKVHLSPGLGNITKNLRSNTVYKTVDSVSFSFLRKVGQNEIVWIIGGQVCIPPVCKTCDKLGGSGGMLPRLIMGLLLDTIW